MESRRIVVTGMGTVSAAGVGTATLWETVRQGRPCAAAITRFDPSRNACRIAAETPPHNRPSEIIAGAIPFSRTTSYAMTAAAEAFAQVGLRELHPDRCGVCLGSTTSGIETLELAFNSALKNDVPLKDDPDSSNLFAAYIGSSISATIAARWGFQGPVTTVSTGCASGLDSIGYSLDTIRQGEADLMVAGGTDASVTPLVLTAFDVVRALSRRNDAPEQASRPFDRGRDGFLLAEGAGVLVLEELEHALKRGAIPLAEIQGYGTTCNAFHMTGLPEDGEMMANSIALAITDAGLMPGDIDYVNAHGSSTPLNDKVETMAYKMVFGGLADQIPISSTKSVIGHPLGAAGGIQAIVCTMALRESWLPPTANLEEADPECDLDYIPRFGRKAHLRHAVANSNSFAGIHSALVIGTI